MVEAVGLNRNVSTGKSVRLAVGQVKDWRLTMLKEANGLGIGRAKDASRRCARLVLTLRYVRMELGTGEIDHHT